MSDTELQQLIVWVGTQAKIDEAKQQGQITDDDFVVVTDAPDLQEKLTSANAGTGISITEVGGVVKISNTQTSAEWGNILGNLPDQADLWTYVQKITGIEALIPAQASSSNQLADKAFVNSTTQTATANFRGNWTTWSSVPTNAEDYPLDYAQSRTPTVNDYLVVQDASGYTGETLTGTWRFKYSGEWSVNGKNGWHPEYQVNETPLTAAQIAALNSGATTTNIGKIGTLETTIGGYGNIVTHNTSEFATSAQGTKADTALQDVQVNNTSIVTDGVAKLQTSTAYGTGITGNSLYVVKASDADITAKSSAYKPIVPNNLDKAVKAGVTTNSVTLTSAEKDSARNWIGAEAQATIQTLSATDSITLADNTIYNGGEQTALTMALPATVDVSFLCEIDFTSGTTPATLAYPNSIKWIGDDVASNVFIPVASKRYTIIVAYDGVNYRANVKGV